MQIPDLSELIRLAQTPTGRQLSALLQQQGGTRLQPALASAASGAYPDYTNAQAILSELLASPDAQVLLKELEERA